MPGTRPTTSTVQLYTQTREQSFHLPIHHPDELTADSLASIRSTYVVVTTLGHAAVIMSQLQWIREWGRHVVTALPHRQIQ